MPPFYINILLLDCIKVKFLLTNRAKFGTINQIDFMEENIMKAFMDKDFLLESDVAKTLSTDENSLFDKSRSGL